MSQRLYECQRQTTVHIQHLTVSNCLVNMVSPRSISGFALPFDRRVTSTAGLIRIHNCAWNTSAYIQHYATLPGVGCIDIGMGPNLVSAKESCPDARRVIMLCIRRANLPISR